MGICQTEYPHYYKIDKMEFFSPHFIGMEVTFTDHEGHAGTWVLTRKVSDTSSQFNLLVPLVLMAHLHAQMSTTPVKMKQPL
jgi:hypothetical protein